MLKLDMAIPLGIKDEHGMERMLLHSCYIADGVDHNAVIMQLKGDEHAGKPVYANCRVVREGEPMVITHIDEVKALGWPGMQNAEGLLEPVPRPLAEAN